MQQMILVCNKSISGPIISVVNILLYYHMCSICMWMEDSMSKTYCIHDGMAACKSIVMRESGMQCVKITIIIIVLLGLQ